MNKHFVRDCILDIVIAAIIVLALSLVLKPVVVNGESMDDTLQNGNYLIVNKLSYVTEEPDYGDIVVINSDYGGGKLLIKRVIAKENDTVETDGQSLWVNGEKRSEPYLKNGTVGDTTIQSYVVPEECCFVMGDNRDGSVDSRSEEIGFIPKDEIVGKAIVRLFPFDEIGVIE